MSAALNVPPDEELPESEVIFSWGDTYENFLIDAQPLILPHWREVGAHRDILRLLPDHLRYQALERAGMLHILLARKDGVVVGYFFLIVMHHPRDRHCVIATDEIMYVAPQYRRGRLGLRMRDVAVEKATELGVHILMFRRKVKRRGPDLGADMARAVRELQRDGFEPMEIICTKVIKDPHPEDRSA